jgi:hypothetical protein
MALQQELLSGDIVSKPGANASTAKIKTSNRLKLYLFNKLDTIGSG